jgi:hypothetical protein
MSVNAVDAIFDLSSLEPLASWAEEWATAFDG